MNKYFKMCAPALLVLSLVACGTDKAQEPASTSPETSTVESQESMPQHRQLHT